MTDPNITINEVVQMINSLAEIISAGAQQFRQLDAKVDTTIQQLNQLEIKVDAIISDLAAKKAAEESSAAQTLKIEIAKLKENIKNLGV